MAAGLLTCCTSATQAEERVVSSQVLAKMDLDGMEQISDSEGEAIRGSGTLIPALSLNLEKLVLLNLSIRRSTTVFVQNELALDLNVLVANRLNLAIGNIGNEFTFYFAVLFRRKSI